MFPHPVGTGVSPVGIPYPIPARFNLAPTEEGTNADLFWTALFLCQLSIIHCPLSITRRPDCLFEFAEEGVFEFQDEFRVLFGFRYPHGNRAVAASAGDHFCDTLLRAVREPHDDFGIVVAGFGEGCPLVSWEVCFAGRADDARIFD